MQLPLHTRERSPLSAETRHSAMLLGGALGIMSMLALIMFVITTRMAG